MEIMVVTKGCSGSGLGFYFDTQHSFSLLETVSLLSAGNEDKENNSILQSQSMSRHYV
jgi:hypothetical protein